MIDTKLQLASLGLDIPFILLPQNIDIQKWAVVACDQFTQDYKYWEKVKDFSAGDPSTLNLIIPEIFLTESDISKKITDIHSNMKKYLKEDVFCKPRQGFIYTERDTPFQKKRRGLIAAIDLEHYEWLPDARPLIRSTEGTVVERLPPRMDIRRGAPLELPHVLLLIDDDTENLLSTVGEMVCKNKPVYNTPLMMDSGNVSGWFIDTQDNGQFSETISLIAEKLDNLYRRSSGRYNNGDDTDSFPFLFAVGDGNHSLAAAKGIWEEYKMSHYAEIHPTHPCRYALVEIENIYDPAIQFEPIHRVIFGMGFNETVSLLSALPDYFCRSVDTVEELVKLCESSCASSAGNSTTANCFGIISEGRYALIGTSAGGIATACLQPLLDDVVSKSEEEELLSIDYIHGVDELLRLANGGETTDSKKATGILLPPVKKSGLFETVSRFGPLPRKSFSMGHSCEKRFYLECRSLTK